MAKSSNARTPDRDLAWRMASVLVDYHRFLAVLAISEMGVYPSPHGALGVAAMMEEIENALAPEGLQKSAAEVAAGREAAS